jgi:hypothetical protein
VPIADIFEKTFGRYDNLYRVPATGGSPVKLFDCADHGLFLCLGDFMDDGTLAYTDGDRVVHVVGGDGVELAAIATAGDYASNPTFNNDGGLIFYTAELDGQCLYEPAPGTIYITPPPYTDAPVVVYSADHLTHYYTYFDPQHLVINYNSEDCQASNGYALLELATGEVTPIEPWRSVRPVGVWPAE